MRTGSGRTECTSRTLIWECTPPSPHWLGFKHETQVSRPVWKDQVRGPDLEGLAPKEELLVLGSFPTFCWGKKKSLVLPWCFSRNHHSTSHVGKHLRTTLELSFALIPRISTAKAWPTPSYFSLSLLPPPSPLAWVTGQTLLTGLPRASPSLHNPLSEQQADGCIF